MHAWFSFHHFSNDLAYIVLSIKDFGDGGAFPEIHIAQYPLGMAMKKSTSNALATQVDATGKIKYDVIARHGHAKDKVSYFLPLTG